LCGSNHSGGTVHAYKQIILLAYTTFSDININVAVHAPSTYNASVAPIPPRDGLEKITSIYISNRSTMYDNSSTTAAVSCVALDDRLQVDRRTYTTPAWDPLKHISSKHVQSPTLLSTTCTKHLKAASNTRVP
jgi:hypothetical protein